MNPRCAIALLGVFVSTSVFAKEPKERDEPIDHVLLLSIDGLHALDVSRFVKSHPHSALATLSRHGVTYSNASSPPSTGNHPSTHSR